MKWKKAKKKPITIHFREVDGEQEEIHTKEGVLIAKKDRDFIIRGIEGELYPINKEIFYKTYNMLEDEDPYWERGMTIAEWQRRIKQFNWKRFGEGGDTPMLIKALLLMGTEITELYDEYTMQPHNSNAFAEELADNMIRTINFAVRANINLENVIHWVEPKEELTISRMISEYGHYVNHMDQQLLIREEINAMPHIIMRFTRVWRKHGSFELGIDHLSEFIQSICTIAWLASIDLDTAMIEKMAYNTVRNYTQGKGYDNKKW